ncbi:hypothetical protein [Autumnicola psychrophila]|uniref:Redox-active disulfide protein 2 n=1 Tax=Autumnicola psychrophila TaxID=3075592 RepID=A0ABU3DPR7_9FLAO|nr:hypothetical protein [Zunongwangia sp. F225]MDT0685718.1 hypothetical protein [Zunongwangia sp. F225]
MKELSNLNNKELIKKRNAAKTITAILLGLFIVSIIASGYNFWQQGYSATTLMPLFIMAILATNFSKLQSIKKELRLRKMN